MGHGDSLRRVSGREADGPFGMRWLDVAAIAGFFLGGIGLMYVGYFFPYTSVGFAAYAIALVVFGCAYVVYFGALAPPQTAMYSWLAAFLLFPKKELRPGTTVGHVLFNTGFAVTDFWYSLYAVLNVFFVLAIVVAAARVRRDGMARPPRHARLLKYSLALLVFVGIVHICWLGFWRDEAVEYNFWRMFGPFWAVVEGLVVLSAGPTLIRTRKQVETLFGLGLAASVVLLVEFVVVRNGIVPAAVAHYGTNLRGGFKSVIESSDLLVGLVEIFGIGCACYAYASRGRLRYLLLALASIAVVQQTYYRGPTVSAVVVLSVFVFASSARLKWKAVYVALLLLGSALWVGLQRGGGVGGAVAAVFNVGVGDRTLYSVRSTFARFGAAARGIDVFLYRPWFGAGPGNVVLNMASGSVPSHLAPLGLSGFSSTFYEAIREGAHPTNPHDLAIMLLAEYGILAVSLVAASAYVMLGVARSLWWRSKRPVRSLYLAQLAAFAMLTAYGLYFILQATPYIFGLLALLVVIADRTPEEWLNERAGVEKGWRGGGAPGAWKHHVRESNAGEGVRDS